jgi:hypothetical protein
MQNGHWLFSKKDTALLKEVLQTKKKRLSISKTLMIDHVKPSESEFHIAELAERLAVSQN